METTPPLTSTDTMAAFSHVAHMSAARATWEARLDDKQRHAFFKRLNALRWRIPGYRIWWGYCPILNLLWLECMQTNTGAIPPEHITSEGANQEKLQRVLSDVLPTELHLPVCRPSEVDGRQSAVWVSDLPEGPLYGVHVPEKRDPCSITLEMNFPGPQTPDV